MLDLILKVANSCMTGFVNPLGIIFQVMMDWTKCSVFILTAVDR